VGNRYYSPPLAQTGIHMVVDENWPVTRQRSLVIAYIDHEDHDLTGF
jgi:hypothetical protein